jgi:bifunctional UDP-N-acetylglucosamine pyrophosphorylase/glucosamine-1-phosphate N-acetyltransferase
MIPTKALLLAGGRGKRLGILTVDRPKPMLEIAGIPMIERIMTAIAEQTPIREFVLVTGYLATVIENHFGDGSRFGWKVEYVDQGRPLGVGHAVGSAAGAVGDTTFLMTYGDIMLDPVNYGSAVALYEAVSNPSTDAEALPSEQTAFNAVVGLNWVADPWAGAAVYLGSEDRIERIVEKPERGTAATHWNNAGLFVFEPMIFEYALSLAPSARGEFDLPDAINAMIAAGHPAKGLRLEGAWRDVGTPEDYEAINQEYGAVNK